MKPEKDAEATLRDLRNAYYMPFRYDIMSDDYHITGEMVRTLKQTIRDAGTLIKYLKDDRDSLLEILEEAEEKESAQTEATVWAEDEQL